MKVSKLVVDRMVRDKIVKEEERDIYDYGIDQIFFTGINIVSMVVIGIFTQSLLTILIFSLFYMVLRVYAGGYHADTQLKCFIFSNLMVIIVVGIDRFVLLSSINQVIMVVISSIMILWLGPVDTITKKLDDKEHAVYKKRMVIIMSVENALFIGFLLAKIVVVSTIITLSFLAVMIMLMGGVMDNRKRKEVEE